jgi:glyoxylase-like metal-dependent hydrolase (beta-lactamase superfamily II)
VEYTYIGNRGILFTFNELNKEPYYCITNVYVIVGKKNYFVCDTYLGKYYINKIKEFLESKYGKKNYIVFNSHSHWDHIWGNSEFKDNLIVSHEKCREFIKLYGEQEIKKNPDFIRDEVELILPNITFQKEISFEEEGLIFFYSPGHSEDSSSCYDIIDNTLFVGDNVDDPIPSSMCFNNLSIYLDTLKKYLELDVDRVIQSHGPEIDNNVIRENALYIRNLIDGKKIIFNESEVERKHQENIDFLLSI